MGKKDFVVPQLQSPTTAPPRSDDATPHEANKGVHSNITNTMTLELEKDGKKVRVRDTGLDQQQTTPVSTGSGTKGTQALLNKIQFADLEMLETLGAGSQGKVKKCKHKTTGEVFAVKYIPAGDDNPDVLLRELQTIENRPHPNVVTSREAYFRSSKLLVVLEFMDAGTMSGQLKKRQSGFPEDVVSFVAKRLLQGLVHLHSQHIVHRDIKPANLLCNTSGEVKISDFGVAAFLGTKMVQQTTSSVGSTPYMSPERVAGKAYSFESDVWSAGVTVAECLIGAYPFGIDLKGNVFRLCERIVDMKLTIEWPDGVSDDAKDFINQCLRPAETRPSSETLLSHKFMQAGAGLEPEAAGKIFSQYS